MRSRYSHHRRRNIGLVEGMLWLSFWLMIGPFYLMYLAVKHGYPHAKRFYSHPDPEVRRKRRMYTGFGMAVFFGLSIFSSLAQTHFASAALSALIAVGCGFWGFKEYRKPIDAEAAALAARAEIQHQQWYADDPRGTYGPGYTPMP